MRRGSEPIPPLPAGEVPDAQFWSSVAQPVPCGRCGYDLRMLVDPRCPECGLQFRWTDLFADRRARDPLLYEYGESRRPVRAWLRTTLLALWPPLLWSRVPLHGTPQTGPLWRLILLTPWLGLAAVLASLVLIWAACGPLLRLIWPPPPGPFGWRRVIGPVEQLGMRAEYALTIAQREPFIPLVFTVTVLGVLLGVLAMLAGLRHTLGRRKVRTGQILRVVAYTAAAIGPLGVLVVLALALELVSGTPPYLVLITLAVYAAYLAYPLHRFLHLPRPALLALTAVFTAVLFVFTVTLFVAFLNS